MMQGLVGLGKDHTLTLYAEKEALHLVGPAMAAVVDAERNRLVAQRPPLTDEEIADVYLAWDVTPGRRIVDLVRAVERKVRGEKE
jgi:hypothetical protein